MYDCTAPKLCGRFEDGSYGFAAPKLCRRIGTVAKALQCQSSALLLRPDGLRVLFVFTSGPSTSTGR